MTGLPNESNAWTVTWEVAPSAWSGSGETVTEIDATGVCDIWKSAVPSG